jgi:hypothetical protein
VSSLNDAASTWSARFNWWANGNILDFGFWILDSLREPLQSKI